MKFCNSLSLLLLISINSATGVVDISPSGQGVDVAPVCQAGDQLELMCTTTSGTDHRWEFTVFPENVSYTRRPVSSTGVSGIPTTPLSIGTSMITFLRLSGQNVLPLISRIIIDPVSSTLNGTVVNCFELATNLVATTTIQIIDSRQFELSIQSDPEDFSSDGVIVTLEWTLLNPRMCYQQFLGNVSVSTNPPPNSVLFTGIMRVQLELSYNTLYIVNVTQHSTCQLLIRTKFLDLNFSKCSDPVELTNAIIVVDYVDPALEGQSITFTCPLGLIFYGSNTFTCMGNGEWEPDPGEMECTSTDGLVTVGTVTIATCNSPPYVLRIGDPVRDIKDSSRLEFNDIDTCCSGFLITSTNTTTCLENGEWELDTSQMNSDCEGMIATLRIALISVTCVLIVTSLFTFITGIVCGYYINQRLRASTDNNKSQTSPKDMESELELKENIAYITIHPST